MPARRPRRPILRTYLVVVEGETELAFCLHLKRSLSHRVGAHIRVESANGKSPKSILRFAAGILAHAAFDEVVALFDADQDMEPEAHRICRKHKIECLRPDPCFEGWLLGLLGAGRPATSRACKEQFEARYLDRKKKLDASNYGKIFPSLRLHEWRHDPIFGRLHAVFANRAGDR